MSVKAKKKWGQHFLTNPAICERILTYLTPLVQKETVLEVGPGMGALTSIVLEKTNFPFYAFEIDEEAISFLNEKHPTFKNLIHQDFLHADLSSDFLPKPLVVIGNFPYNISSQILFKCLAHRSDITGIVGMFQKEVAQRICEKPGSRQYGILSVLMQAFYEVEYAFTIKPGAFNPPPKVESAVIFCKRRALFTLACDEKLFFQVVKMAFNQRRKMLRNSLKSLLGEESLPETLAFARPEQLDVPSFVLLTQIIQQANEC
ncbi:MAG: 16S rRNA (adenine(1518)-N(6)/adenine(1519)-N(6))-dimethyltransferase RsmA [Flavobacteriales bacterium]